jgi:hypothetical protein
MLFYVFYGSGKTKDTEGIQVKYLWFNQKQQKKYDKF